MANQTINYGASANLTANGYTRTGYNFMGWTATEGGTTVDYADQASYNMNTLGATLYAVWQEIKPNGITLNATSKTIKDNETLQLIATVSPDTALDTSVAWSTSDADVATVSTNGLVTAKAVGTATITATCNGDNDVTATCTVTVEPSTVNVKYMDYNPSTNTFTEKTQAVPVPNKVTSAATAMSAGWYYVEGTVENANRITVTGTVNLILCDGAQLTASKGITVNSGNTLNIYAQTNGTGKLTVTKPDYKNAGIGGGPECDGGNVTINGGTVTVTGGADGAGIGGGYRGAGGNVTINGGTVTATGSNSVAGIGGGYKGTGGNGTLTVAEGLGVFGGDSANPTAEIEAPYTSRPRYMVVKKILSVETFNTSEAPSSSIWPINYSLTDFKVQFRMKTQNGMYIASGANNHITVSALTGKNIEKMEVKLGSWWASSYGQYLTATKGTVVLPETVTNGSVITINDINATSVKLALSHEDGATNIDSIKVYYYK